MFHYSDHCNFCMLLITGPRNMCTNFESNRLDIDDFENTKHLNKFSQQKHDFRSPV